MNHSRYFKAAAPVLALCLILGGCGTEKPSTTEATLPVITVPSEELTEAPTTTQEPTTEAPTTQEPTTEEPTTEPEPEPITFDPVTVADKDDVKVLIQDYYEEDGAVNMNLSVQNGRDKEIALRCTYMVVNGYTVDQPAAVRVEASKTVDTRLTFDRAVLDELGITEIGEVKINYNVLDTESGKTLFYAEPCEIKTSFYDSMTDAKEWNGKELYNKDDVLILFEGTDETPTGGMVFKLYVENNSKNDFSLISEDVFVNGRPANVPTLIMVDAGQKTLAHVTVTKSIMDKYGITAPARTMELSLKARGNDWKLMFETGTLVCDAGEGAADLNTEAAANVEYLPSKLLLDEENIMVASRGWVAPGPAGPGIKLQIANNNEKPVRFRVDSVMVDDYLINNCGLIVNVGAGETADAVLWIDLDTLNIIGNEKFGTIVLGCSAQDAETLETLKTFDPVALETADKEEVKVVSEKKGMQICNDKNLRIVVVGYSFSENLGARLYMWIKNSSSKEMVLNPTEVLINDISVLCLGKVTVPAGKMTIGVYTVPAIEVQKRSITDFEGMTLHSEVYDYAGKLQFKTLNGGIEFK